jgi:hypothetical protein
LQAEIASLNLLVTPHGQFQQEPQVFDFFLWVAALPVWVMAVAVAVVVADLPQLADL